MKISEMYNKQPGKKHMTLTTCEIVQDVLGIGSKLEAVLQHLYTGIYDPLAYTQD